MLSTMMMDSLSIPPAKRYRACREMSLKIPRCSLLDVMKYLDEQSLNKLTETSSEMQKIAKQYVKNTKVKDEPMPQFHLETDGEAKPTEDGAIENNMCKHLDINSHLHLNLCQGKNEDIDMELNRVSIMDILNGIEDVSL